MDILPASIEQVRLARDGKPVVIEDDVGNIAARLQQIDPRLKLQWNEKGEFFTVVEDDGTTQRLVLSALEVDDRIIKRVEEIAHPDHDYVAELQRIDAQADRDKDHAFAEVIGEAGEVAAHGLRKDLQSQSKVFVP